MLGTVGAALAAVLLVGGPSTAADHPDPVTILLPSGQGVELDPDSLTVKVHTGAKGTPVDKVDDFGLDLVLFRCSYAVASDGTVSCSLGRRPAPTPSPPPTPVPSPPPAVDPTKAPAVPQGGSSASDDAGDDNSAAVDDAGDDAVGARTTPEVPAGGAGEKADIPVAGGAPRVEAGDGDGDAPSAYGKAAPLSQKAILDLGVTGFAVLALIGGSGLAAASGRTWRKRYPPGAEDSEGSVLVADNGMYEFDPDRAGPGDHSRWWRLLTGWLILDRLSRSLPKDLSLRAPLLARIAADGSYLRAILGVTWLVVPVAALVVGVRAASYTDGLPLPPSVLLTAALICLGVLDASAGLLGVAGFAFGVLLWGPGDLGFAPSLRSFLGLAALWFAIPLIASASRPLRRTRELGAMHTWDRLADGVIAALVSGWAVQGAVGGMAGLSGRQSPIDPYADRIAVVVMAAVLVRVVLEEISTRLFPERLTVVDTGILPEPSAGRAVAAALVRTAVFVFVAEPFVGNSWQLWVGGAVFVLPSLLGLLSDRFPNSELLYRALPRGVAMVLFMLVVGMLASSWASTTLTGPDVVRNGFVLLALPGLVVSLLSLVGRDGPAPARSWRNELLGLVVVAVGVALVLG
ncbi:hypothetical protein EFK50_16910 [Nocardioides marmoriginsengisoli]|uniref:Uncharacterized protein n=1 Tax=Nocardioides marmoriginsengisoli TaxID=661483 RepID=A0A3N0CC88_9ACTN|nr:hypothetical protein EFK50_16910 [Nocardioides marmoriginsengisoli]